MSALTLVECIIALILFVGLLEGLLLWLAAPVGLRLSAGAVYLVMIVMVLKSWPATRRWLGWANRVTLLRGMLVAILAGAILFPDFMAEHAVVMAVLALGALILDGLDGWIARLTRSATAFGARFDMELDAFFILVLCLALVVLDKVGAWVLLIGLMRYGFILAGQIWPWLNRTLPESRRRKIICVWQALTLLCGLLPLISNAMASGMAALSLLLLSLSFLVDIRCYRPRRKDCYQTISNDSSGDFDMLTALRSSVSIVAVTGGLLLGASTAQAEPQTYRIDPEHFSIGFLIDHIGYQKQLGMFLEGEGEFVYDEQAQTLSSARVEIPAASLFTNHEKRDGHVLSDDFLDAEEYPAIVFEATDFNADSDTQGTLTGDLTMLGETHPVTLDVTLNKAEKYPFGHKQYTFGLSARTTLNRSEWGMTYGVDNGMVGDEVELIFEFEGIRQ
ncbi:YceI family protein [Halomonas sp. PR-M31]|uniref:YceI family protein n=1 Tax=Halomonas sp. PR-M31 TaxID=1471202 RepID=UPI00209F79A8|nr:YceI family protein [Halomonas sp. PR-M31]